MFRDFLNKFFAPTVKHGTGALINPEDPRDIPAAAFQDQAIQFPREAVTQVGMLPIADQGILGSCVGHAIGYVIKMFEYLETGKIVDASFRFIYGLSKQKDGQPDMQGTFPRVGAGVVKDTGCATVKTVSNDISLSHEDYVGFKMTDEVVRDAFPRKVKGYAFPELTLDGLKNAILNNKFFTASLTYGNWTKSPVKPSVGKGNHYIFVHGYEDIAGDTRFYFINSWGKAWDHDGRGYFLWSDYQNNIRDVIVYTDIPDAIMEEYKAKWPYKNFTPLEVAHLDLKLVDKLQAMRDIVGVPIKILSGFRSADQNEDVGGVKDSAHMKGLAVDIECIGSRNNFNFTKAAFAVGFRRIGDGGARNFLHLDIDSTKDQDVKWHY